MLIGLMIGLAAAGAGAVAMSIPASAARVRTVTAHSIYGHGSITAPVRPGRFGPEVRLPGGTWISCKLDCRTTLREETIDFWDTKDRDRPSRSRR